MGATVNVAHIDMKLYSFVFIPFIPPLSHIAPFISRKPSIPEGSEEYLKKKKPEGGI